MMQRCPNCDRPTARTIDWACQWCGYPLLHGNYQKLTKTFKQLQEERKIPEHQAVPEEEAEVEAEFDPGAEYRMKPPPKPELRIKPIEKAPPVARRPEPEPVARPNPVMAEAPVVKAEPPPPPEEIAEPEPVRPMVKPQLMAEAQLIPEIPVKAPKPELMPEAGPVPDAGSEPKNDVVAAPSTPPPLAPEPAPQIDIKALLEKDTFTTEELDLLYQADQEAAEAKFEGKTLIISGAVDRAFSNDSLGIYYLVMGNMQRNGIWNVRCTFEPSYSSELKKLQPGQMVTVRGKYGGHGKNIILKECIMSPVA
ncbi:MAG: hypothetical protein PHR56_00095 [Dehalococcoidales bacterium]|nr:hypothetical protein [Dehalococcoidales bacterium]